MATKKVRYNKKADAYVVKTQDASGQSPCIYEVTLAHGDLAIPHGMVTKYDHRQLYHTYRFSPGHSADKNHAICIGTSVSLQEAIDDVRQAWLVGAIK